MQATQERCNCSPITVKKRDWMRRINTFFLQILEIIR